MRLTIAAAVFVGASITDVIKLSDGRLTSSSLIDDIQEKMDDFADDTEGMVSVEKSGQRVQETFAGEDSNWKRVECNPSIDDPEESDQSCGPGQHCVESLVSSSGGFCLEEIMGHATHRNLERCDSSNTICCDDYNYICYYWVGAGVFVVQVAGVDCTMVSVGPNCANFYCSNFSGQACYPTIIYQVSTALQVSTTTTDPPVPSPTTNNQGPPPSPTTTNDQPPPPAPTTSPESGGISVALTISLATGGGIAVLLALIGLLKQMKYCEMKFQTHPP